MEEDCRATQLVYGDGKFNADGLDRFVKEVKLAECGVSYGVVAVVGRQSSGKSALQNHLFNTKFMEMIAKSGRSQTTKGIWIAKCVGMLPCTIAIDLEGTDGRGGGQDDIAFENQSALFALAVSDTVLINIKGYSNYALIINAPQPPLARQEMFKRSLDEQDKPFLQTFFQVMMRFSIPRKTTLLFVIHDNSKTPFQHWQPGLRKFILNLLFGIALEEIWNGVPKPQAHKSTRFSDFFSEEVVVLSSYAEEKFKEEVAQLKQRLSHSISPGGFAGDRRGVVPASGFSFSAQQIWKVIEENKDLDLPAHKVMVATVRCEEIAREKFNQLIYDKGWLALEEAVQTGPVQGFGKRLSSILGTYLSKYDIEAIYFDEGARNSKRQLLESKALDFVYLAYTTMLGHVRSKALEEFKVRLEQSLNKGEGFASCVRACTHSSMLEFDKGCADAAVQQANWDASRVREKLQRDIDAHASSICSAKLSELNVNYEKQLSASLTGPVKTLLETGGKDTWASIRKLLSRETEIAISEFSTLVADFELDKAKIAEMLQHFMDYSRKVVEKKAREEAMKIMIHMKDRFSRVFNYDSDSMLRVWTGKEDIRSIIKDARSASMMLLSVMAAIRLDEKPDNIEKVIFSSLMDGAVTVSSSQDRRIGASADLLASSNWEEVSSEDTLITPVQCQSLWRQFIAETENSVTQAISAHVMVATVRCEEIANQKFSQLIFDEDWLALEEAVQIGPIQGFGKRLSSILSTYLSKYDIEAIYFEEGARNSKRQLLESKALDYVYPVYTTMLGHVCSKALEDFKVRLEQSLNKGEGFASSVRACTHSSMIEFDKGCADAAIQQANWDASRVREKLQRDIDAHAASVCSAKLSELNVNYERQMSASLIGRVEALFETGGKDTWASIRKLLNSETEVAVSEFSTAVAEFELDKERIAGVLQHLRDYSRNVVEKKAREEATKIMIYMKDRFSKVFNYDSDSMPRVWTEKEDIRSITKDAHSASMKLLSVMAAIRLDEKPDNIEKVIFSSLTNGTVTVSSSQDRRIGASVDPLASSNWEEVSSEDTLITPVQCKSLWRQFTAETENSVTQAISAQVMHATVRCEEIANHKFSQLIYDENWLALEEAVQIGPIQGFGKRLSSILSTYLSAYDIEAICFDEGARNSKRQLLEVKALDFVYPAYTTMLGHVHSKALEDFKVRLEQSLNKGEGFASCVRACTQSSMIEFDKGCADAAIEQANWDASRVHEKLQRDIDAHVSSVCSAKLSELNVNYEKQLSTSLTGPVEALLETGGKDTWASIRKLYNHETEVAVSEFSIAVAEFELDKETIVVMLQHLRDYSRNTVEKKAREEATKIMIHMKDRFSKVFYYDSDSKPRVWTKKEDIRSITKDARSASMELLSVLAAIRLDEKPDNIEKVISSSVMDGTVTISSSQDTGIGASADPLALSTWEEVSSEHTLITPVQCKSLWTQFIEETENSVAQAIAAQCEDTANQKFSQLIYDEGWLALEEAVQIGPIQGFGKRLSSILNTYLSEYDVEAIYFDEGARNSKRQLLESKALDLVYPAYTTMLGHVHSKALEDFKVRLDQSLNKGEGFTLSVRTCTQSSMIEFDKGCADAAIEQANWDASRVREKLQRDIDAHASSVCRAKLTELNVNYERQLFASLTGPVEALLETGGKDTWGSIRKLINRETEVAISKFSTAISDFELDKETIAGLLQHLRDYSRNVVEKIAREEATEVMIHMKDRFFRVFNCDSESMPRVWTEKEDIRSITKDARSASLNLLSIMAAIRLDEKPDNIEKFLFSSLMDGTVTVSSSQDKRIEASAYPLASSTWDEVSSKDTLITPVQCKSLWTEFKTETEYSVTEAILAQEAYKQSNNWLPPPWATMAIVVHCFNQFMLLLK